ncbi:TSC22 domain family protein 1 isoform X2 [Aix galericulata]|nr:TSC22 domain family protein 1 isoform X2 [Aix galericulata]
MDLGVYQLRHFSISFLSSLLGTDSSSLRLDSSSSGASVVAIDNKIEQAMVRTAPGGLWGRAGDPLAFGVLCF